MAMPRSKIGRELIGPEDYISSQATRDMVNLLCEKAGVEAANVIEIELDHDDKVARIACLIPVKIE